MDGKACQGPQACMQSCTALTAWSVIHYIHSLGLATWTPERLLMRICTPYWQSKTGSIYKEICNVLEGIYILQTTLTTLAMHKQRRICLAFNLNKKFSAGEGLLVCCHADAVMRLVHVQGVLQINKCKFIPFMMCTAVCVEQRQSPPRSAEKI